MKTEKLSRVEGGELRPLVIKWLASVVVLLFTISSSAQTPAVNPDLEPTECQNLDVVLILDESGSIDDGNDGAANEQSVRDAAVALANGLSNSGATLAVIEFSTTASISNIPGYGASYSVVTPDYVTALSTYVNSNYNAGGWTNWEDAFDKALDLAATQAPDLVVFVTDGNPTAYIQDGPCTGCNDSDDGACTDCGATVSLNAAIPNANALKNMGAHMFGLAVAENINLSNIADVTGPDEDLGPGDQPGPDPAFAQADYTQIPFSELVECLTLIATVACDPCNSEISFIEFETDDEGNALEAGDDPSEVFSDFGIHITTNDPVNHPPMIFDTANPTGNDDDLGTPNEDFGGPGIGAGGEAGQPGENDIALHNVLIISEDGDASDPNDHGGGGTIIFDFDSPQDVQGVVILDIDYGEIGGTVTAFDAGDNIIGQEEIIPYGSNSVQTVVLYADAVSKLEVFFVSSGAVPALLLCDEESPVSTIGDFVYVDGDCDDVFGNTQIGIPDVTVSLFTEDMNLLATTTTNDDGLYEFNNLLDGNYIVQVDGSDIPAGYTVETDLNGSPDNDSGVFALGENENKDDVDFGYGSTEGCCEPDPSLVCPDDAIVECNDSTSPDDLGEATVSGELCDLQPEVDYDDSTDIVSACTTVITRTWTLTIDGVVVDECEQTITITDLTDPVITCPDDVTLECGPNTCTVPDCTGVATGTDNCGDPTITFIDQTDDGCGNTTAILRTWTATDACGNSSSCAQTILVLDNTPPSIACPGDVTLECGPNTCTAPDCTGVATGSDNCGDVIISHDDNVSPGCGNSETIARTWIATDECGNQNSCVQIIMVLDNTDPTLHGLPDDVEIDCEDDYPPVADVTASDNCDENPDLDYEQELDDGECPHVLRRTWTATDDCGNSTSHTQEITIIDDTPPVIDPFDIQIYVECDEVDDLTITAEDNCSEVTITFHDVIMSGGCLGTLQRTWYATDECGNQSSALQYIVVQDTTGPEIIGVGDDMVVECDNIPDAPDVTAEDNCGYDVELVFDEVITPGDCDNEWTITWTWTATDVCGNVTVEEKVVTVVDTTDPVFGELPGDLVLDCNDPIPPAADVTATDNCGDADVVLVETSEDGDCPQEQTIYRTWTATDACGNAISYTQTIEIEDNTAPTFDSVPADVIIECSDDWPTDMATASDDCGTADVSFDDEIIPTDCDSEYTIVRTFTATDECGNSATAEQIITVEDNTAPELSDYPDDLVLDCEDEVPAPPVLMATDNCDNEIEVVFDETIIGDLPDPDASRCCQLIQPVSPHYDPDWALWLAEMPNDYQYYTLVDGMFYEYDDGTAHITATVVSTANADAGWQIDVWLQNGLNWDDWSNQEFPTSYKDDFNEAGDNYLDWTYYLINNDAATLTGWGDFAGSLLELEHAPSNLYYGYQVGIAANNVNTEYGSGGWITYDGFFQDTETGFEGNVSSSGDFAFDHDCCPQYEIEWTWTAMDCAGNTTSHTMTVSFEDLDGNPNPTANNDDSACPADFNENGLVDTSDLLHMLASIGCEGPDCDGDLDGDGTASTLDLLQFLSFFGTSCN